MAGRGGISGLAVAMGTAGLYLVYAGIRNVPLVDGLRQLARGELPAGTPVTPTQVTFAEGKGVGSVTDGRGVGSAGSVVDAVNGGPNAGGPPGDGGDIVAAARQYIGKVSYKWGAENPNDGFDCSGFVTWVLVHDIGLRNLPDLNHTVSGQFYVWKGATTVPRSQARPGDLACWVGHVGIVSDYGVNMINAAHAGTKVREQKIWGSPLIRRVKR